MNAPTDRKVLALEAPAMLKRHQPAKFGWWSDRTLMIIKGEETMLLDADDLSGLRRFFDQFSPEGQA